MVTLIAEEHVLAPKAAMTVELRQGQVLRVTDLEGQQVVDMAVWNLHNLREKLSTSYSRTRYFPPEGQSFRPRMTVQQGDWVMSGLCRPLMTILTETADPPGTHGVHHRMCNAFFYASHGAGIRDGCFEQLAAVAAPYGVPAEDIPDSFDIFQNYPYDVDAEGFLVKDPVTRPGDYIEFRAEMDLLVALSNCPDDEVAAANAFHCTSTGVQVRDDPEWVARPVLDPREWLLEQLRVRGIDPLGAAHV
ncbi:DUF1989 domain-containing protein [Leifsonia bigeumensis]|uniref:DUF1989 domain-containing protein n=1 Tax=Leifsonella bigeumensis TaxID=433643 RepID=A0ABP7FHE2_9MICO